MKDTDVVLVFLTRGYLGSKNCRRELVQTLALSRTLLLVRETDENHGAATEGELLAEVERGGLDVMEQAACRELISRYSDALEWHRELHLKRAVVSTIVARLFDTSGTELKAKVSIIDRHLQPLVQGSQRHRRSDIDSTVHLSPSYSQLIGHDVYDEVAKAFLVPVARRRQPATPVIILLFPGGENANERQPVTLYLSIPTCPLTSLVVLVFEIPSLLEKMHTLLSMTLALRSYGSTRQSSRSGLTFQAAQAVSKRC